MVAGRFDEFGLPWLLSGPLGKIMIEEYFFGQKLW
jgi:hypothetical protein